MRSASWAVGLLFSVGIVGCGGRVLDDGGQGGSGGSGNFPCIGAGCLCAGKSCPGVGGAGPGAKDPGISKPSSPPPLVGTTAPGSNPPPPATKPPPPIIGPVDAGNPGPARGSGGTAIALVDGGYAYYALGGVTRDGLLVAAYWTGNAEALVLLDPATGGATFVGFICDLHTWGNQLVYDEARGVAYALGENDSHEHHVYTVPLSNGRCTSASLSVADADGAVINYIIGGVSASGEIVAAYWNGRAEATALINPKTGATTFAGTMGDLFVWQGQFAFDDSANRAYALGQDRAGATHLYSLSLAGGAPSRMDVEAAESDGGLLGSYVFSPTTASGRIVAAYWNGEVEQAVVIDPMTGQSQLVGHLGNLYVWPGQLLYGRHASTVYAIGQDRAGTYNIYTLPVAR